MYIKRGKPLASVPTPQGECLCFPCLVTCFCLFASYILSYQLGRRPEEATPSGRSGKGRYHATGPGEGLQVDVKKSCQHERSKWPRREGKYGPDWLELEAMGMVFIIGEQLSATTLAHWNQGLLGFVRCNANISDSKIFTSSSSRRRCFASICRRFSSRLFEVGAVATLDCMACATSTLF